MYHRHLLQAASFNSCQACICLQSQGKFTQVEDYSIEKGDMQNHTVILSAGSNQAASCGTGVAGRGLGEVTGLRSGLADLIGKSKGVWATHAAGTLNLCSSFLPEHRDRHSETDEENTWRSALFTHASSFSKPLSLQRQTSQSHKLCI